MINFGLGGCGWGVWFLINTQYWGRAYVARKIENTSPGPQTNNYTSIPTR